MLQNAHKEKKQLPKCFLFSCLASVRWNFKTPCSDLITNGLIDHVALSFQCVFLQQCHKIYSCPLCQCYALVSGYFQKYKEFEKSVRVEEIDGVKLVKNLAVRMEEMFRRKAEATRVSAICLKTYFYSAFTCFFINLILF